MDLLTFACLMLVVVLAPTGKQVAAGGATNAF
jgi:hypothetical protein